MIINARGGGSVTPRYHRLMRSLIKKGKLHLITHSSVAAAEFHTEDAKWTITTQPETPDLPSFDRICFATGVQSDVSCLECLSSFFCNHPIPTIGGLPVLTEELKWKEDVPLFVAGRLAALRLGPGAGNLEGARSGAERIAWALEDMFQSESADSKVSTKVDFQFQYALGLGSRYDSLRDETSWNHTQ